MDPRQFRHFVAVAETLHFGRAAERLGITQPPLSQSILALEKSLGAPLFARTKRHVELTPLGQQWLPHVREALAALDALPDTARRLRDGQTGRLSLSFVSTADYSVLPDLVRRYAEAFPGVEIQLIEATSDVQVPAVLAGERHAGIIIPPPNRALPAALAYRRLVSEPLVAVTPEAWAAEGPLDLAALAEVPLVLFPRNVAPAFHDLVTGYVAARGQPVRIVQEAIQMQTIISLVSAGLGMALAPASLRKLARTGVRYVDLVDPPILETGLVWRRDEAAPTLHGLLRLTEVDGSALD
ncbi:DNA-binding transcriptional LysR family regulator [Caulobacter sp. BE264]|uniref:LysR substrate-binding domain-containing protein n=1 Tax=Caulobacter sp. BE264 TaxID=2817724 RepID=UPI002862381E|nr:LysR substrate-binding domain-containing protein [Caulobacter sp. BE264]MDR7232122.1 DNA-binding transcriptional LysR family regulator [Caulobacter sp. BE264]